MRCYFKCGATTFVISRTKHYVRVVTQDHVKLFQKLKSSSKRATSWNEYQSKVKIHWQNQYLHYFIDPGFQAVKKRLVFSFQNNAHQQIPRDTFFQL